MRIGLIGTFDVDNFGDCMFPELYSHLLRQSFVGCEIDLYSPTQEPSEILTKRSLVALPVREDQITAFDSDILLLIGGETIGVGHSAGTYNFPRTCLSAYLRLWLSPILAMHSQAARPVFFAAHCVGAIKMTEEINRRVARALGAAGRVRFRDRFSASWIRTTALEFECDVDPMFLIDHIMTQAEWQTLAEENLPNDFVQSGYIVGHMSIGYGRNDLDAWVNAMETIAKRSGLPVVLLPICHFLHDEAWLAEARKRFLARGVKCHLVRGLVNVKVTAAIIGASKGYIGSSLHGAVTAVAFAQPLAVLGHSLDGKHEGTLRSVGLPGLVSVDPEGLPDIFAHATTLDHTAHRASAQEIARTGYAALVEDIKNRPALDVDHIIDGTRAAAELIQYEFAASKPLSKHEMKRVILRTIRDLPIIGGAYEAFRFRKKLSGLFQRKGQAN